MNAPSNDARSGPPCSPIDVYVGKRLQAQRVARGLSVDTVAQWLLVSPDAVVGWENGTSRIPAIHLLSISQLMSCPLKVFFDGFIIDTDVDMVDGGIDEFFSRYSAARH